MPNPSEPKIVNVRIPQEIVQWLDSLVSRGIYTSRAEAIREFCRDYLDTRRGEGMQHEHARGSGK